MACLSCFALTGHTPGCYRDPAGGTVRIWIVQPCDIEANGITRDGYEGLSGKVTDISLQPSACWQKVVARQQTVNLTDQAVAGSGSFVPTLQFLIEPSGQGATQADARQAVKDFVRNLVQAPEGVVVIFEEASGVRSVLGISGNQARGAFATEATAYDSGTAYTDVPGQTIVLSTNSTEQPPVLDPAYVIVECAA